MRKPLWYFWIHFVYVVVFTDYEAPTVNCVEGQTSQAEKGKATGMVLWKDPIASDNSGNVSVTCDPPSGTHFKIGERPITCEAVDGSGNRAECSFPVTLIGNYCGCALSLS